ncbi:hypothetical protein Lser_V15G32375 [Lactuca serriola]
MEMVEEGQNQPKIATKRIKFEEIMEVGGGDRITALPDCLLVEILSRLPSTEDAIRTSTLSKRWKHLWTSVPSLIFDDENHPRLNFVSLVTKTLNQCRQQKLKKFVVSTGYDTRSESQVHNWIRYAVSCNVEELNLKVWNVEVIADEFVLDQFFFINSCFTDLRLSGCILNPIGAISWKNLRSLWISEGNLDEDLIENILSGSPQLETLVFNECYGYKRLDITSKSVKNLVFNGYYWVPPDDECDDLSHIIEINAPNILSLTIEGDLLLWKLLLVNVSSLIEANLDYTMLGHHETTEYSLFGYHATTLKDEEEMLEEFILNLSHVNELKIRRSCSKVVSRLEFKGFVFPSNIKFPDAIYDWSDSDSIESGDCYSVESGDW